MNSRLNQISEERDFWKKASSGWIKWNDFIMQWHRPIGLKLIELLRLEREHVILDVGTGTGEPGLTAAPLAAKVSGIDLSAEMADKANENAKLKGAHNFSAVVYDGIKFPFEDKTFDSAVSRNGVIFFPDMKAGMDEVRRVLKAGGRIAFSGWGPPENNDSAFILRRLLRETLDKEPVAVGEPGPFRFSETGSFAGTLSENNFQDVNEMDLKGSVRFDSFEHYFNYVTESHIVVVEEIEKSDGEVIPKIRTALTELTKPCLRNGYLEFRWHAVIAFGRL